MITRDSLPTLEAYAKTRSAMRDEVMAAPPRSPSGSTTPITRHRAAPWRNRCAPRWPPI